MFQAGWEQSGSSRLGWAVMPRVRPPSGWWAGQEAAWILQAWVSGPSLSGQEAFIGSEQPHSNSLLPKEKCICTIGKKEREKGCLSFQAESGCED